VRNLGAKIYDAEVSAMNGGRRQPRYFWASASATRYLSGVGHSFGIQKINCELLIEKELNCKKLETNELVLLYSVRPTPALCPVTCVLGTMAGDARDRSYCTTGSAVSTLNGFSEHEPLASSRESRYNSSWGAHEPSWLVAAVVVTPSDIGVLTH
jgi:hypothetical protein